MDEKLKRLLDKYEQKARDYGWSSDQGSDYDAEQDLKKMTKARKELEDYIATLIQEKK